MTITWTTSKEDADLLNQIADRAVKFAAQLGHEYKKSDALMDVTACHANGCPMRLQEFLEADASNFAHDAFGIQRHINRDTGKLEGCFLPRFYDRDAAKESGNG
jgi:hypothetical protein